MSTSISLSDLTSDGFAAEKRPSSQQSNPGAVPKSASNSIRRAPRSDDHMSTKTSDEETPRKASPTSTMYVDSANRNTSTEEQGIQEENSEVDVEQEEALRALEAYAAFQITLLQHITDNPTFYDISSRPLSPTSSRMPTFEPFGIPEKSILGSDPRSV
jgi:hypothetical protein